MSTTARPGGASYTPPDTKKFQMPNDEQWRIVKNCDDHLLVAAGAGTGKTSTVIYKILHLLGVQLLGETHPSPLQLSDIAAITYTNHAAAEIKDKLRTALRAVGRRADAYRVDSARVGTIHSFCGDVLREFALRAQHPPGMTLIDEAEGEVLRFECIRDVLITALEARMPDAKGREADLVSGLDALIADWEIKQIEGWVGELVRQGDHLRVLAERSATYGESERALVTMAVRAKALMEKRLFAAEQMDFDRMIEWTRDLIRDDPTVRRALQRRIKVLIIDEFQDVDPVQREIAYLLGDPESRRTDTTRLMLVGDPKQSIFRFRRADVRVWRSVERDFAERRLGTVMPLSENRRSVPGILGFVDHALGALLDSPSDPAGHRDFEVKYAAVTASRVAGEGPHSVELLVVPPDASGKTPAADDLRASEARAIASRASELHDTGLAWRDMAVLLASWSELDVYESALRDIGAPTYSLRITGFYETSEISDLVVALRAIRDLRDDRALFGFLRGPFVGVSDETLMRIARAGDSPYWSVIARAEAENVILRSEATKDPLSSLTDHDERARLDWGTSLLTRFGALRDRTPAASLLETLLNESGHLAYLAMMGERGRQQIANVRKFLQIVRGMPSASIADVLATVERARDLQAIEGDARLYGAQDDVLTITSIHSSKGLEWPVVFWADLVRTKAPPRSKLVISEGDIALADPKITDATAQPAHYRALRERVDHEENAEAKRLWYVAATRAKDLLVVSGIPVTGARKTSPADAIKGILPALDVKTITYSSRAGQKFVARVREVALLEVDDPMPSMTYGLTQVDVSQHSPATDGPLAPLVSPPNDVAVPAGRTRHSATELLLLQRCPRKRWFKYVIGLREPASERSGSADEVDAVRRGLIVHDVLEHFSEDEELSVFLEDAIGRWDPEAPPPDAKRGHRYRASLRKDLESVLSHPEYRAVFDRPDAERELSFVRIKRRGTYVEGQIDLVAPNDCSGYSVIDVKTSQCDADAAAKKAEQYAVQKAVYVDALEEIGTRPVESFGFQFSGPGVQVGGTISADEREKLGLELAQAVQAMRTDPTVPPPMTTNPQECRFCGYRRAGWCAGAPDL